SLSAAKGKSSSHFDSMACALFSSLSPALSCEGCTRAERIFFPFFHLRTLATKTAGCLPAVLWAGHPQRFENVAAATPRLVVKSFTIRTYRPSPDFSRNWPQAFAHNSFRIRSYRHRSHNPFRIRTYGKCRECPLVSDGSLGWSPVTRLPRFGRVHF